MPEIFFKSFFNRDAGACALAEFPQGWKTPARDLCQDRDPGPGRKKIRKLMIKLLQNRCFLREICEQSSQKRDFESGH